MKQDRFREELKIEEREKRERERERGKERKRETECKETKLRNGLAKSSPLISYYSQVRQIEPKYEYEVSLEKSKAKA